MDDARGVRGGEGVGDLARDAPGLGEREAATAVDLLAQRGSFEERHHQVGPPVVEPPDGEDVDDAGVPDSR